MFVLEKHNNIFISKKSIKDFNDLAENQNKMIYFYVENCFHVVGDKKKTKGSRTIYGHLTSAFCVKKCQV